MWTVTKEKKGKAARFAVLAPLFLERCRTRAHFRHRMTRDNSSRSESGNRPAFAPWAWLMLVVVLLSAAPINGQPRSRLVGSAFDPASVSVVVRPGKTRLHSPSASVEKRKAPDSEPGNAPFLAIVEGPDLATQPSPAAEARTDALPPTAFVPRRPWRAHPSRAPPAA